MAAGRRVRGHDFIVERPGRFDGGFMLSLGARRCVLQLPLLLQTLVRPHLPAALKHTLIFNIVYHLCWENLEKLVCLHLSCSFPS